MNLLGEIFDLYNNKTNNCRISLKNLDFSKVQRSGNVHLINNGFVEYKRPEFIFVFISIYILIYIWMYIYILMYVY